jgi:hypothetical protein
MTTSGLRTWELDFAEIMDDAIAMAGGEPADAFVHRYGRRAANRILSDWSNRSLNLWQMVSTTMVLSASVASYALPDDCLDVTEVSFRDDTSGSDIDMTMGRLSRSEYAALSNKATEGRPSSFVVLRELDGPRLIVWPAPDTASAQELYYWYIQKNQDVTSAAENIGIPTAFLHAFTQGMAYEIGKIRPVVDQNKLAFLKQEYMDALLRAMNEDRERVPTRIFGDFSPYWR